MFVGKSLFMIAAATKYKAAGPKRGDGDDSLARREQRAYSLKPS